MGLKNIITGYKKAKAEVKGRYRKQKRIILEPLKAMDKYGGLSTTGTKVEKFGFYKKPKRKKEEWWKE